MLTRLALLAVLFLPQSVDTTAPPANVRVKATATGIGVQIYNCTQQGDAFQWHFQRPQATLFDAQTRQPVGTHSEGPTWTWNDGSAIIGTVLHSAPSPDRNAVAWLLVETHPTTDSQNGTLSTVTMVRRSDTQAGMPTIPCDAQNLDVTIKVPYQATYTFYEPR